VIQPALVSRRVQIALRAVGSFVAIAALLTTALDGSAHGGDGTDPALQRAVAATNRAYEGTNRPVDPTPRAAVKGKHIVVVSAGQASGGAGEGVEPLVDAAETIGWDVDVYDGKLTPATYPGLVRQAVAAGADAIVLAGIDCQVVKQPLEEARAKRVVVTGIGAFDCSDPAAGGSDRDLFDARINFGAKVKNVGAWVAAYGDAQANYVIAKSKNQAKVLLVTAPEFTTLHYIDQGFRRTIRRSKGSEIVGTVEVTTADFVNNQLVPKIQAELLRHPDVDWVRSPFAYATTLGVVPALGSRASGVDVMGGEGTEPEIDLVRNGKVTATNVVSLEWESWAVIDTVNSVFRGEKPVDSGFGWVMTDRDHNLPSSGLPEPTFDYKAAYEKAWGVR
jgi:ribose transport system substrate-binding protein